MEGDSEDPAAAAAADHETADSAEQQQQQQQQQQTEELQQLPQQEEEEKQEDFQRMQAQDQQQQSQQQEPQQEQQQPHQEQQQQAQQQQRPQQQQQQQAQQQQQPHQHQSVGDEDILNAEESRLFIDELERRISLCEAAVGLGAGDFDLKSPPSSHETSVVLALCRLQHQATAAMRGSLAEMESKCALRPAAALAAAAALAVAIAALVPSAAAAAATVDAAAATAADSELKVWLEGGPLSAARLLLTLQAKRDCVLQQEEQLLAVASQLRNLHLLQQYVNPPCLSELAEYKRRMHALEAQGSALALQVARLEERVTNLAALYSTTRLLLLLLMLLVRLLLLLLLLLVLLLPLPRRGLMASLLPSPSAAAAAAASDLKLQEEAHGMNMVSSVIEEWHRTLSKAEAAPDDSSASSEDAALRLGSGTPSAAKTIVLLTSRDSVYP
ncbi:hypothetical protein Emag_005113 [Eimeria magna]